MVRSYKCFSRARKMPTLACNRANNVTTQNAIILNIIIKLMTLDEVNTTIYQPQRSDYHRGHHDFINPRDLIITEAIGRGDNQISGVVKSWY
jgi:hypothetical protein